MQHKGPVGLTPPPAQASVGLTPAPAQASAKEKFIPKRMLPGQISAFVESAPKVAKKSLAPGKVSGFAVVTSFFGNIWDSIQGALHLKSELKRELNLAQKADLPTDPNKLIQTETVSALLRDPDLWAAVSKHREAYLNLLKKEKYQKSLEAILKKNLTETGPALLSPESQEHILRTLAKTPQARGVLSNLIREASPELTAYFKKSPLVLEMLEKHQIPAEQRAGLIEAMLPAVVMAILEMDSFVALAGKIKKKSLEEEDLLEVARRIRKIAKLKEMQPILVPEIFKPILVDVLKKKWSETSDATIEKVATSLAHLAFLALQLDIKAPVSGALIDPLLLQISQPSQLAASLLKDEGADPLINLLLMELKKFKGMNKAGPLTQKAEVKFKAVLKSKEIAEPSEMALKVLSVVTRETILESGEILLLDPTSKKALADLLDADTKEAQEKAGIALIQAGKLGSVIHIFIKQMEKISSDVQKTALRNYIKELISQQLNAYVIKKNSEKYGPILADFSGILSEWFMEVASESGAEQKIQVILDQIPVFLNPKSEPEERGNAISALRSAILSLKDAKKLRDRIDLTITVLAQASGVPEFKKRNSHELSALLFEDKKFTETLELKKYLDSEEHWAISKFFKKAAFGLGNFSFKTLWRSSKLETKIEKRVNPELRERFSAKPPEQA